MTALPEKVRVGELVTVTVTRADGTVEGDTSKRSERVAALIRRAIEALRKRKR